MKPRIQRLAALALAIPAAVLVLVTGWVYLRPDPGPAVSLAPAPAYRTPPAGALLDINTASAEELEELPGIGPALAERILARREEYGLFHGPEDLQAVSGIGEAACEAILPYITFRDDYETIPQNER